MIFAQSNRTALLIRKETAWGEIPVVDTGNVWSTMRFTSESIDLDKKTTRSEVIRADRMSDDLIYLGRNSAGDISGELAFGEWDNLMAAAVGGTWVIGGSTTADNTTQPAATLAYDTVAKVGTLTLTGVGDTWAAHSVIPNIVLALRGATNASNNRNIYVTSIAGAVLTFTVGKGAVPVNETITHLQFHYEYVINGFAQPSFSVEKQFQDIGVYVNYPGLYVDTMSIDASSGDILKVQFSFMGTDTVVSSTNTSVASSTGIGAHQLASLATKPQTASVNVGQLLTDGSPFSTGLKSIKFDTSNNLRIQDVVGSETPGGYGQGEFAVKGTTESYFANKTPWLQILTHEDVSQFMSTRDIDGNEYGFGFPRFNYSKGAGKVGGKNQDVTLPLEWEASRHAPTNSMLVISRMPSAPWV